MFTFCVYVVSFWATQVARSEARPDAFVIPWTRCKARVMSAVSSSTATCCSLLARMPRASFASLIAIARSAARQTMIPGRINLHRTRNHKTLSSALPCFCDFCHRRCFDFRRRAKIYARDAFCKFPATPPGTSQPHDTPHLPPKCLSRYPTLQMLVCSRTATRSTIPNTPPSPHIHN